MVHWDGGFPEDDVQQDRERERYKHFTRCRSLTGCEFIAKCLGGVPIARLEQAQRTAFRGRTRSRLTRGGGALKSSESEGEDEAPESSTRSAVRVVDERDYHDEESEDDSSNGQRMELTSWSDKRHHRRRSMIRRWAGDSPDELRKGLTPPTSEDEHARRRVVVGEVGEHWRGGHSNE